jgi:hypothetical protein
VSPKELPRPNRLTDLVRYRGTEDFRSASAPYTGTPRKHPWEANKMILVAAPFSPHTIVYEFRYQDVTHAEELPNLVNERGENVRMAKIWVKKGSLGMRIEPFRVEDTPQFLADTEVLSIAAGSAPATKSRKKK